jgi:hypothetical protein
MNLGSLKYISLPMLLVSGNCRIHSVLDIDVVETCSIAQHL